MKANELMIGDWCRMKLTFGTQWYMDKVGCVNPENELEYEPIPLTEEILMANGWKHQNQIGFYHKRTEFFLGEWDVFGYPIKTRYAEDTFCFIKHVYELQHVLRICGLNDLADNFKLKEE